MTVQTTTKQTTVRARAVVIALMAVLWIAATWWFDEDEEAPQLAVVPEAIQSTAAAAPPGNALLGGERMEVGSTLVRDSGSRPADSWTGPPSPELQVSEPLRVLILSPFGTPIPGASVAVLRRPLDLPLQSGRTDSLGEIRIIHPQSGDEFVVRAAGFVDAAVALGRPPWPSPFPIRLADGHELLRGRVLNDSQLPVPGASLALDIGPRTLRAVSDEQGKFSLLAPLGTQLPASVSANVTASGYCWPLNDLPLSPEQLLTDGEWRIRLLRWGRLSVEVLDYSGEPVDGARLSLLLDTGSGALAGPASLFGPQLAVDLTVRPPSGDLSRRPQVFPRVAPRLPLVLAVDHPDTGRREFPITALEPGEARAETVTLHGELHSSLIRFRVVTSDGGAVTPGRVTIHTGDERNGATRYVDIPPDGTIEVERPGQPWGIFVMVEGYAQLHREFEAHFHSQQIVDLTVEPTTHWIEARVTDMRGRPEPNILVSVLQGEDERGPQYTQRTLSNGRASFRSLDESESYSVGLGVGLGGPGRFLFFQQDDDRVPNPAAYRGVRPGDSALHFELVPPGSVSGRVRTPTPDGARIQLSWVDPDDSGRSPLFSVSTPVDADGGFRVHGLPPGRYHLWSSSYSASSPADPVFAFDLGVSEDLCDLVVVSE